MQTPEDPVPTEQPDSSHRECRQAEGTPILEPGTQQH